MRGQIIAGKYKLQRKIGAGGMGTVWEALDQALQRRVAIKLIGEQHNSENFLARFQREARALAQIQSDHIVQVFDFGVDEGAPYMVMELLSGEDLEARLRREEKLPTDVALDLIRQTANGLTAAAVFDIVHRDLKPANLFLTTGGGRQLVKILDFGVAWMAEDPDASNLTMEGTLLGTPHYMSPEQIRGRNQSILGDLWSLGIIAYRALTGRFPFPGEHLGNLIVSICMDAFTMPSIVVPDLPKALDGFFKRALAKNPQERFPTASEFIEALSQACDSTTVTTILAVDDEPDIAYLLKTNFRKQIRDSTYRFLYAENGQLALEVLRQHPDIDVILSDINMPVMDGLTLLKHIPPLAPFARTVIVSAYDDMDNIRRAMNLGAFDFVVKPIEFQDLDTTVKKAARTAAEHRAMASSDRENKVLRQMTSSMLNRRMATLKIDAALNSEAIDATVVAINVHQQSDAQPSQPAELARRINANYEVIVPILQQSGGIIDSLDGDALICVWTGLMHQRHALDACWTARHELGNLVNLAGEDTPFAQGLGMGVSTGRLLATCIGSTAGERLSYTVIGSALTEAMTLARNAERGEILVSDAVHEQSRQQFKQLEETASRGAAADARPAASEPEKRKQVTISLTSTLLERSPVRDDSE